MLAAPPPFRALLALLALAGCTFQLDGLRLEDDFARAGDASTEGEDLAAASDDAGATDDAGVPDLRSPPDLRPDLAVETKVDLAGVADLSRADLAPAPLVCGKCPPIGWGAVLLGARKWSDPASPCPSGWSRHGLLAAGFEGLSAPKPACTPCACGAPAGVACAVVGTRCVCDANDCKQGGCGGVLATQIPGDGSCANITDNNGTYLAQSCTTTLSGPIGGACAASGGAKLPFSWNAAFDLCSPVSPPLLCIDKACLPAPSGPYGPVACVAAPGDQGCPKDFPKKRLLHGDAVDARVCAPCACAAPSGGSCGALAAFACAGCAGPSVDIPGGGCASTAALKCMNPDGNGTLRSFRLKGFGPGSCKVAGGGEGGDVLPTNPWTICCPP